MTGSTFTLSDGRVLGFQDLGDPEGEPLFFFHGTPGSRLALSAEDALARLPGVRLITPERPGYGLSDPQPGRTIPDWPNDVAELADHLGLGSFSVSGESGGGPHTLACAALLGERVTRALVLASPAPANFRGALRGMSFGNRIGFFLARYAPRVMNWVVRGNAEAMARDPQGFLDAMARQMEPSDRQLMDTPAMREALLRDFREAYRQGSEGHAADARLAMTSRDWGFDLSAISVPVFLWHGEDDTLVTRAMAEALAREIPGSTLRIIPGAGHLLTEHPEVFEEIRDVLGSL